MKKRFFKDVFEPVLLAGFIIIFLVVLGYTGKQDADAVDKQVREYCSAVFHGKWPDYNGNYDLLCRHGVPRP
jgi:hypothetical protein